MNMKSIPCDPSSSTVSDALTMMYTAVIGAPPRAMVHRDWRTLGFQADDPTTDFRGMGCLGLLNLVYLCTVHTDLARNILEQSNTDPYWFPFAITGINITNLLVDLMIADQRTDPAGRALASGVIVHDGNGLRLSDVMRVNTHPIGWCVPWGWMVVSRTEMSGLGVMSSLEYHFTQAKNSKLNIKCDHDRYVISPSCLSIFHELYVFAYKRWVDSWLAYSTCLLCHYS